MNHPHPDWYAGAAEVDITPQGRPFLAGYPNVQRYATGVHDSLLASALCVSRQNEQAIFVACDVVHVPRDVATRARQRIEVATGVSACHIMVTATHTHSGPVTVHPIRRDSAVPEPDPAYLAKLEAGIVEAATLAASQRQRAWLFHAQADVSRLGSNRRDPAGPRLPQAPVLVARSQATGNAIAVMIVCSMHPTVLHEDSLLISGDFPGIARAWLKQNVFGEHCPLLYHLGAAGNQSPRHVVRANTLEEARRLGEILGREVQAAMQRALPSSAGQLRFARQFVELPLRQYPPVEHAQAKVAQARQHWQDLQRQQAPPAQVRTAECDVFGAERALILARASADGQVAQAARRCMPAEVQVIAIGEHAFVGWPGEVFVEFALQVMQQHANATIITLANGSLHGYLVTPEAIAEGGYEASNSLFVSPDSGQILVRITNDLLTSMDQAPCPLS